MSTCSPLEAERNAGSRIVGSTDPGTLVQWTALKGRGVISTVLHTRVVSITLCPQSRYGLTKRPIKLTTGSWGFYKTSPIAPPSLHRYTERFDELGAACSHGAIIPWTDIMRIMAEMSEADGGARSLCGPGKPFIRIEVVWKY